MSYFYRVYGLNVKSEILIPELTILEEDKRDKIDVNICYKMMDADIRLMMLQGKKANYENKKMWFHIDNLATYCITNGNKIDIQLCENPDHQLVKVYILGSVLGMVLLQKNIVAIHGGGVVINDKGYVFTGDKGAGKSTLTTALRQCGYGFIADDVCSIKQGEINKIYPGFGYQKLCDDTMIKLGYTPNDYEPFRSDFNIKYIVPALDDFVNYEVPFEGIFELTVSDVESVEIKEITGIEKIQSLIKNIFRIEMLHYSGGINSLYFKKCADIAKSIKYYKLTRPKDVFSVNEQIEVIENIIYKDEIDKLEKLG
ncbi:phosphoenolpyruvate carboxykinase (ATP) [Romboutsia timonensis]|uniref:hypothetical protein n=1 Tax=Romboutsia timonensis TaxID=1776391 RepID=UPI0008DA0B5C|nr:hypothetical protein [Romboutsia timonensis]